MGIVNTIGRRLAAIGALLSLAAVAQATQTHGQPWQINMPVGVTEVSHDIFHLHMFILSICVVIAIGVYVVMAYSLLKHRKSRGHKAAHFHENTLVEVIWTVIPFILLVIIAVPATKTLLFLEDTERADMTVKITGYQWKWQYEYLDDDVSFFSNLALSSREAINADPSKVMHYLLEVDNPLVLPVGKKVRFVLTSNDVIHSWWVPELGIKQDAIPGFINDTWAKIEVPGIYRGQCAELCGKDHAFMPIVVEAKSEADYQAWLTAQKTARAAEQSAGEREWTMDELMTRGEQVYNVSCAACHGVTGGGIPGVFPGMLGSAIAIGDINAHIDIVINGKAGTAMQAFRQQLSDADLAAVVTYERNAFGNNTGDVVQPATVKAFR